MAYLKAFQYSSQLLKFFLEDYLLKIKCLRNQKLALLFAKVLQR